MTTGTSAMPIASTRHAGIALAAIGRLSGSRPDDFAPETELVADLGFDSVKLIDLLMELEERLDIKLQEEDVADMSTIADLLTIIERKLEIGR